MSGHDGGFGNYARRTAAPRLDVYLVEGASNGPGHTPEDTREALEARLRKIEELGGTLLNVVAAAQGNNGGRLKTPGGDDFYIIARMNADTQRADAPTEPVVPAEGYGQPGRG